MTDPQETPLSREPWYQHPLNRMHIYDACNNIVALVMREEDAERIVAAVNEVRRLVSEGLREPTRPGDPRASGS